jgi:hypothetical protein
VYLLSILASWLSLNVIAPSAPTACQASQHRELDYLGGRWKSVWLAKNVEVGRYTFEPAADGCALVIKWTGAPDFPGNGTGLLTYDPGTRRWHYVFVGDDAALAILDGQAVADAMTFEGSKYDPKTPQQKLTVRLTFKKGEAGAVTEAWQQSRDGGKTWLPFGQFRLTRAE